MDGEGEGGRSSSNAGATFKALYVGCSAIVLLGGIPILLLGMAYFGSGVGSALNSFRMGLAEPVLFSWALLLPVALLPVYLWLSFRNGGRPSLPAALVVGTSCLFGLFLLLGRVEDKPLSERPSACHRGVYALDDGRLMAVSLSPVAALNVDLSDGTRVMTWGNDDQSYYSGTACIGPGYERDHFEMSASSCPAVELIVKTQDASEQVAQRISITEEDASFEEDGLEFRAKLFQPVDALDTPLVILPARRNGFSRLDWGSIHYLIAGLGFSVFIYEKPEEWPFERSEIASDEAATKYATAALAKARSLVSARTRVGFFGDDDALRGASLRGANFAILNGAASADLLNNVPVTAPVLWLLPSNYADARRRSQIERLRASGRDITLVVLPPVDEHGAWYQTRGGVQCHTNEPPDYWQTVQAWVQQRTSQN